MNKCIEDDLAVEQTSFEQSENLTLGIAIDWIVIKRWYCGGILPQKRDRKLSEIQFKTEESYGGKNHFLN